MTGEMAKGAPVPVTLRRFHELANGRLEIMTFAYDLDGALDAGQTGLARYSAMNLLDASVAVWLRARNIEVPVFEHQAARGRVGLRLLAAVNPVLAERVSRAYLADVPTEAAPVASYCRTVLSLVGELTGYAAGPLTSSVTGWARSAHVVRTACERLGLPLNDFYWPPPEAETWYSDVLRFVSEETSRGG